MQYLGVRHELTSELRVRGDDAILVTSISSDDERWNLTIDTESSTRDGTQRVVMVYLDGDFGVQKSDVEQMRELLNKHNEGYWAGVFFLDEDDDILGKWAINIPGVGVHPEQVADAIHRLSQSWLELLSTAKEEGIERIRHAERKKSKSDSDKVSEDEPDDESASKPTADSDEDASAPEQTESTEDPESSDDSKEKAPPTSNSAKSSKRSSKSRRKNSK